MLATSTRVSHLIFFQGQAFKALPYFQDLWREKDKSVMVGGGWSLRLQMLMCWMTHNYIRKSEIRNPHLKIWTFSWAPKEVLTKVLKIKQRSHWRSSKRTSGSERNRNRLLCPGRNISLKSTTALSPLSTLLIFPPSVLEPLSPLSKTLTFRPARFSLRVEWWNPKS